MVPPCPVFEATNGKVYDVNAHDEWLGPGVQAARVSHMSGGHAMHI